MSPVFLSFPKPQCNGILIFSHQMYGLVIVSGRRKEYIYDILCFQFQARFANTGMATEIFILQNIFIDEKPDDMTGIVHKPQDRNGARKTRTCREEDTVKTSGGHRT